MMDGDETWGKNAKIIYIGYTLFTRIYQWRAFRYI